GQSRPPRSFLWPRRRRGDDRGRTQPVTAVAARRAALLDGGGRGSPLAARRVGGGGGRAPRRWWLGGVGRVGLAPDQVVQGSGRQLALWGPGVADDRIDRAASRVQAMLGHTAVTT